MLLTSVIIVLREFLEAALIVSVLLALCESLSFGRRWIAWSAGAGLIGAAIYAGNTAAVSDWFGGVGQEVMNALMQIIIYCCLAIIAVLLGGERFRANARDSGIVPLMTVSVGLAITREGSEIILYLSGFANDWNLFEPILLGGLIGAGIGASVGALTFYALMNASRRWSPYLGAAVIVIVAAGMASQATGLLIQADWLPSQLPLWDTSGWISEASVTGQLLYAAAGYEATPTPIQVAAYFGGLLLPLTLIAVSRNRPTADA